MRKIALHFLSILVIQICGTDIAYSQTQDSSEHRKITALRLAEGEKIEIDGTLGDAAWARAIPSSDFTQFMPQPWVEPSHKTVVRIAYDDEAIYVGARMYDPAPDSILKQLTARDRFDNTDDFGFWFSPYNDGNNGFMFKTNPVGVKVDLSLSAGGTDRSWNAVWYVESRIDEEGWVAEFKIPWAAIRFSSMEEGVDQVWGVNFNRGIRRYRESEYWHPVNPARQGFDINDAGELHGLRDITPPSRLAFYPYVSAYANTTGGEGLAKTINGGVDLKAGIGEAFTLDVTLIPDFGQVVADNLVLNLSPFEVQLSDNRPFFTEGTEIFNKTGLFYSRRVGESDQLINASKFSGRTSSGLGVGAFQAFTIDSTQADALTSYSIAVLDQTLKNNSYIHGISTYVLREGDRDDALVQGTRFVIRNEANTYEVNGSGSHNKIYSDVADINDTGHSWSLGLSKISGKFTFSYNHSEESEFYNPNDMGYLQSPNEVMDFLNIGFKTLEPTKNFLRQGASIFAFNSRYFDTGENAMSMVSISAHGLTTNAQFARIELKGQPVQGKDIFEPRVEGFYWITPAWLSSSLMISTDYRKRLAIDIHSSRGWVPQDAEEEDNDWNEVYLGISPRFRLNDRLSFFYSYNLNSKINEKGYAAVIPSLTGEDLSLFSKRNYVTNTQTLSGNYALSNKATVNCQIRHYWSLVDVQQLYELQSDGSLIPSTMVFINEDGTSEYDRNYNAWSVDLGLRWFFTPGSELSVVWKNTLYSEGDILPESYFENWEQMLEEGFTNSLSIKALFYLDYNLLRRNLLRS
jgi:hypothetical protein